MIIFSDLARFTADGDVEQLRLALRAASPVCVEMLSQLLRVAIVREQLVTAELLLHHGADPCWVDESRVAHLHAAAHTRSPSLVTLLLRHGASAHVSSHVGKTALMFALQSRSHDVAVILIACYDADPDSVDDGKAAFAILHAATMANDADMLRLLLSAHTGLATITGGRGPCGGGGGGGTATLLSMAVTFGMEDAARQLLVHCDAVHALADATQVAARATRWARLLVELAQQRAADCAL